MSLREPPTKTTTRRLSQTTSPATRTDSSKELGQLQLFKSDRIRDSSLVRSLAPISKLAAYELAEGIKGFREGPVCLLSH